MGHWAQNQASAMATPFPDLNPIENECVELKRRTTWICESEGSGEIRYGGMVFCQVVSKEKTQSCYLGKMRLQKVYNKRGQIIVPNVFWRRKKMYFKWPPQNIVHKSYGLLLQIDDI